MSDETKATPMLLWCPMCGARHVDVGEFATKVHHTHSCQRCGLTWRPAIVPTVGVQFLPGFKTEPKEYGVTPPPVNATCKVPVPMYGGRACGEPIGPDGCPIHSTRLGCPECPKPRNYFRGGVLQPKCYGCSHPAAAVQPEPPRCDVCGWPLAKSVAAGCVPGNCSMRPVPPHPWYAERKGVQPEPPSPIRAAVDEVERTIAELREQLAAKERDVAINHRAWRSIWRQERERAGSKERECEQQRLVVDMATSEAYGLRREYREMRGERDAERKRADAAEERAAKKEAERFDEFRIRQNAEGRITEAANRLGVWRSRTIDEATANAYDSILAVLTAPTPPAATEREVAGSTWAPAVEIPPQPAAPQGGQTFTWSCGGQYQTGFPASAEANWHHDNVAHVVRGRCTPRIMPGPAEVKP